MIYSNPEFFILMIVTTILYVFLKNVTLRYLILLASSLIFYSWTGLADTLTFVFVVALSWASAWFAIAYPRYRDQSLIVGITIMALHLFFWKYAQWISHEIQRVFPDFLGGMNVHIHLPVGISFFTLQGIAYLVDLKRREAEMMSLRKYLLFKSFFPQLVAGPIVRVHQLLPQLNVLRSPNYEDLMQGTMLFSMGFFKKMILGDRSVAFIDTVFAQPNAFDRKTLLIALIGYTVQIWADFSGYTDMGRGCARILGFKLPENFLSPYLAKAPSEFWKRWHITLSEWIRDYIYIPLGGSRGSMLRIASVAVITMSISGLWHGANWTFVVWGLYHGMLLVLERFFRRSSAYALIQTMPKPMTTVLACSSMFLLTMVGWLIFRANDIGLAIDYAQQFLKPAIGSGGVRGSSGASILLCFALSMLIQIAGYKNLQTGDILITSLFRRVVHLFNRSGLFSQPLLVTSGVIVGASISLFIFATILLRPSGVSGAFIYFKF